MTITKNIPTFGQKIMVTCSPIHFFCSLKPGNQSLVGTVFTGNSIIYT